VVVSRSKTRIYIGAVRVSRRESGKRRTANARARFAINKLVGRVCIQVIAGLFVRSYLMIVGEQINEIAGNAEMLIRPIVKIDLGPLRLNLSPAAGWRVTDSYRVW
jgi:hypothetical protein